ncbi:MAG TPA: hypothetical protein VLW65_23735 [Bryobacteraceae bacterium]|nr:hypothetical protein [Bryobacteraceae bacterium]
MLFLLAALAAASSSVAADSLTREQILARVAEEAEMLQENIPKTITQETFEQRALLPATRFRPRAGSQAAQSPKPRLQVRQIVSEYSIGTFHETASRDLHEFRQVISVDGRTVQSAENARHALSLGVHSEDDRIRKRMLENFARYGLVDIATDYGLILLEFTRRGLPNIDIQTGGVANIGADAALALRWKLKTEAGGQLEFAGKRTVREPLQGILWVRESDGLPLRVEAWAEYRNNDHVIGDRATVDYSQSSHGFLTPVSVLHRHLIDGHLITENVYRYEPFKMFSSDAEIKFTEVPDPPPASNPPIKK